MYKMEFFVRQITDSQYAADYKLYNGGTVMEDTTYHYIARVPVRHFNDAVNRLRGIVSLMLKRRYGIKTIECVCTNPSDQFLSRSELSHMAYRKKMGIVEPTDVAPVDDMVLCSEAQPIEKVVTGDRVYEVVEVGGIWTIKKHDTKWYTADEAKTQLFAKIVNGD